MGELASVRRYTYWSERRVRSIAADNPIKLERNWLLGVKFPAPLGFLPQAELIEQRRTAQRHETALRMERAIGQLAVEDFVTPPPADFVKGCGPVTLAAYTRIHPLTKAERRGIIAHTKAVSSSGCRVELCLFGSLDNCIDYLPISSAEAPMWSSSSAWAIEEFINSRGTIPAPIYDDDESIAVEVVRVFNNEGMVGKYVFRKLPAAEWFAEVYHDVELDKDRWDQRTSGDWPHTIDRIVICAPLWIRSAAS
ncbi:MAG TPA: hypothetical protein VIY52_06980 [Streptosporangiaceae bacterium]